MKDSIIIDGTNGILGRVASYAAKKALLGNDVVVVNCDKIVISGNRAVTIGAYKEIRSKGGHSQKGPYFPTQPAMIVKRTIRGMLAYKEGRGAGAFKHIFCYEGVPAKFTESKKESLERNNDVKTISLKELSGELR